MIISLFCKASAQIGLGHLIRSYTFAKQVLVNERGVRIYFYLIGDESLVKLISVQGISVIYCSCESDIKKNIVASDISIIDMTEMHEDTLKILKQHCSVMGLISPIFNHLNLVDFYFSRTKYLNFNPSDFPNLKVLGGLEYAIIQENCYPINSGTFEENLKLTSMPIAISMGGGDAQNKTLDILRAIKRCKIKATFWVMIGEKYNHSFDQLIDEIRKDTLHEIILAKTNSGMWSILKNCVLCVLPSGITSFEAAYAGLPSLNFYVDKNQDFLLRELEEKGVAINMGLYSENMLVKLADTIEFLFANKKQLLQMHINAKYLLDSNGSIRILKELKKQLYHESTILR